MAFEEETVLVLGAGASMHYGYPSADTLVKWIKQDRFTISSPGISSDFIKTDKGIAADFVENVDVKYKTLSNLIEFYQPFSVDLFLSQHAHNFPELIDIGKWQIATTIMCCEDSVPDARENWYRYLFNAVVGTKSPRELAESDMKFTIITFNYDVSLEYYLWSRLTEPYISYERNATLNENYKYVDIILQKLSKRILHVYGQVYKYQWQGGVVPNKTYGKRFVASSPNSIESLLGNSLYHNEIKIIGEERKINQKIADAIFNAKNIYFLGYGFHEENNVMIGIDSLKEKVTQLIKSGGAFEPKKLFYTNNNNSSKIDRMIANYSSFDFHGTMQCLMPLKSNKEIYKALSHDFSF